MIILIMYDIQGLYIRNTMYSRVSVIRKPIEHQLPANLVARNNTISG